MFNITEKAMELATAHAKARERFQQTSDLLDEIGSSHGEAIRWTIQQDAERAEAEMERLTAELGAMEGELAPLVAALGRVVTLRQRPTTLTGLQTLAVAVA